jgi:hypothetical protein
MKTVTHILNGDALKQRFPKNIEGDIIVVRECLIEGKVKANSLTKLFQIRSDFFLKEYHVSNEEFEEQTISQFMKIQHINENSKVYLWFEEDLFCQIHFWFVLNMLLQNKKNYSIFLIKPLDHTPYAFSGMSDSELVSIYKDAHPIKYMHKISQLWEFYAKDMFNEMKSIAEELENDYPFILRAVHAHIDRIPKGNSLGRPKETLREIMSELNTQEFGAIFREFFRREAIYGFGDMQVKRFLIELNPKEYR